MRRTEVDLRKAHRY